MYLNNPTNLLIKLFVLLFAPILFYSCQKFSERKEYEFTNYNTQLSKSISSYFLLLVEKVKLKEKIKLSEINVNLVAGLANVKVISLSSPTASQEYKLLFKQLASEIKKKHLIHTSDYKNFLTENIYKLSDKDERRSIIFLSAFGSAISEYCFLDFPIIKTFFTCLSTQMNNYIDLTTGLLKIQIKPTEMLFQLY